MNEKVQSFWYGSDLSPIEQLCLSSFTSRGIGFDLYTYDEDLEVPDGATLKDAAEIYDEEAVFTYQQGPGAGSVAAFANMFRYKMLYERGGWWVDMDVLYTGHELPRERRFFGWQNDSDICNAIMRVEADDPVVYECLLEAERLGSDVAWGEAGPKLLTDVVQRQDATDSAFPSEYVYPLSWRNAPDVYHSSKAEAVQSKVKRVGAPFLHLWNEILRRAGIQKTIAPPADSYLSMIADRSEFEWPSSSVRYSAKSIDRMYENYRVARDAEWRLKRIKNSRSWKVLKFLRLDFLR